MRVAIIGHDKTLPGAGLGSAIDAHDYVVKMLNCGWHNPKDYGEKYDFAIATKGSFALEAVKYPLCKAWVYEKHGRENQYLNLKCRDVTFLIRRYIIESLKEIAGHVVGAGMSRGCAAILTAIEMLEPDQITLFGMGQLTTGTRQLDRHPEIYRTYLTDEQKSILPVEQDHNWQAEHQLIYQVAGLKKCELRTNTNN